MSFAPGSELLLVISHQGRAVFDCSLGERVARDRNEDVAAWTEGQVAIGIGPLDGVRLRVAGLWGGALPDRTSDGWSVALSDGCFELLDLDQPVHRFDPRLTDERAHGFSESGLSLVLATSSDIDILSRAHSPHDRGM